MSRNLVKLLEATDNGTLCDFVEKNSNGLNGTIKILDLLYEHLGQQGDIKGQQILDAILENLEKKDFFKEGHPVDIPVKDQASLDKIYTKEVITAKSKGKKTKPVKFYEQKESIQNPKDANLNMQKKPQLEKESSSDTDFNNFEVEVVEAADLRNVAIRHQVEYNFLKCTHLTPDFKYIYINQYDEDKIQQILEAFQDVEYIGLDSEFHLRDAKCTYIQLASENFGVIINIQNTKFRFDDRFKDRLKQLMESDTVSKVGHSIAQDAKVIKRAFFGDIQINKLVSLEDVLFTCRTSVLGLSQMCNRAFNRSLDKEFQSWIGERKELEEDEEMEYAVMDALAPVVIFNRMKQYCLAAVNRGTFMVNCAQRSEIDLTEILLDHHMDQLKLFLDRFNLKYTILSDKTYSGSRW